MNEQLLAVVSFCNDTGDRFFQIEYSTAYAERPWEVSVFLGAGYTVPGAEVYGKDRWMVIRAATYPEMLALAARRLGGVRRLAAAS